MTGKERISQACDRCRIKKIKCDGNLPQCASCAKINFTCKVSDRLTRDSFPKGYTKTLEKKIINLELDRNELLAQVESLKEHLNGDLKNQTRLSPKEPPLEGVLSHGVLSHRAPSHRVQQDGSFSIDQSQCSVANQFLKQLNLKTNYQISSCQKPLREESFSPNSDGRIYDGNTGVEDSILDKYHTSLNRYLNLVSNKLIFPLIYRNSHCNSQREDHLNLDHLVWKFFNHFNKLIPILDSEQFYNSYFKFIDKYDELACKVRANSGFLTLNEFSESEQFLIIQLIIMMKFSLSTAAGNASDDLDAKLADPLSASIRQAQKLISLANIKKLINKVNFVGASSQKLSIILLLLHYLFIFEMPRCSINLGEALGGVIDPLESASQAQELKEWVINLLGTGESFIKILNLHVSPESLEFPKKLSFSQMTGRLKLFWCFNILAKMIKLELSFKEPLFAFEATSPPQPLDKVKCLQEDLALTIQFMDLLNVIPLDFNELCCRSGDMSIAGKIANLDSSLEAWKLKFDKETSKVQSQGLNEALSQDVEEELRGVRIARQVVINRIASFYYVTKISIHLLNPHPVKSFSIASECVELAFNNVFGGKPQSVFEESKKPLKLSDINRLEKSPRSFKIFTLLAMIILVERCNNPELECKMSRLLTSYQSMMRQSTKYKAELSVLPHLWCRLTKKMNLTMSLMEPDVVNDYIFRKVPVRRESNFSGLNQNTLALASSFGDNFKIFTSGDSDSSHQMQANFAKRRKSSLESVSSPANSPYSVNGGGLSSTPMHRDSASSFGSVSGYPPSSVGSLFAKRGGGSQNERKRSLSVFSNGEECSLTNNLRKGKTNSLFDENEELFSDSFDWRSLTGMDETPSASSITTCTDENDRPQLFEGCDSGNKDFELKDYLMCFEHTDSKARENEPFNGVTIAE